MCAPVTLFVGLSAAAGAGASVYQANKAEKGRKTQAAKMQAYAQAE